MACNPAPSHSDSEWEWVSRLREVLSNHMLSQLGLPASNCDTLTLIHSVRKMLGLACRRESTNTETFPRRQSAVLEPFPLLLKSHILSPAPSHRCFFRCLFLFPSSHSSVNITFVHLHLHSLLCLAPVQHPQIFFSLFVAALKCPKSGLWHLRKSVFCFPRHTLTLEGTGVSHKPG